MSLKKRLDQIEASLPDQGIMLWCECVQALRERDLAAAKTTLETMRDSNQPFTSWAEQMVTAGERYA